MKKTINQIKMGDCVTIEGYNKTDRIYREKLLSMGLTPGTNFRLVSRAPMGDPVEIEIRGFRLTLRAHEAEILVLQGDNDE
ncbi:MAG TPA: FeoA family protein [Spirochaetota bacterium]|nr:FeoA family protein [Spirochaetota bacterium]